MVGKGRDVTLEALLVLYVFTQRKIVPLATSYVNCFNYESIISDLT